MKRLFLSFAILFLSVLSSFAQNDKVDSVILIFKTHLDIGYTDFSCNVERKYLEKFIPEAMKIARELRKEGGEERYVWTTGAWLIDSFLKHSDTESCKLLEEAIEQGDIHWNAIPYTIESESANKDLLENMLRLNDRLNKRFGKKTVAAKMTDVPGHTRSIVPIFAQQGIKMLHVGVNGCSSVPDVPSFFRWQDERSGTELLVCYDSQYGGCSVLPDGKTAVQISFTGDNEGPHTLQQIKKIYADLHGKYPNAKIVAGSLDDVASALEKSRDNLPVLKSEIGDTWIYGFASSPLKIARFRTLERLYTKWLEEGKIDRNSNENIDFAIRLGLVAEHTWGTRGAEVGHFDIYDVDKFRDERNTPAFRYAEMTWKEQDEYIDQAVEMLPAPLKAVATDELDKITNIKEKNITNCRKLKKMDSLGRMSFRGSLIGGVSYQSYSKEDYLKFQKEYVRVYNQGFDKVGLEHQKCESHIVDAVPTCAGKCDGSIVYNMQFPVVDGVDSRVYPGKVQIEYKEAESGMDVTVTILDKPAVRLPEALWFSFWFDGINSLIAEKTGSEVNLLDVVSGGNRKMHFIDRYVDVSTDKGNFRIYPQDAPFLTIGERNGIGYSREYPNLDKGLHFCLFNNLWSTNFNLWWEGSIRYRFHIESR